MLTVLETHPSPMWVARASTWSAFLTGAVVAGCSSFPTVPDSGVRTDDAGAGSVIDAAPADGASPLRAVHVEGEGALVALFVSEAGIVVVRNDGTSLLDRSGAELATRAAVSELGAAAFDGEALVVADGAAVSALDANLNELWSVETVEPCQSLAFVGEDRLVCGTGPRDAYVWRTLNARTGAELARSEPQADRGTLATGVPGRNAFIALRVSTEDVFIGSPQPRFYELDETGTPVAGDDSAATLPENNTAFAFLGMPAGYIVTSDSGILRFDGCDPDAPPGCFVPEGSLETIDGYEQYIGLDSDPTQLVLGLVVENAVRVGDGYCRAGVQCRVHAIDFTSRTITREIPWSIPIEQVIGLRWDRWDDAVVIGWNDCDAEGHCSIWHVDGAALD